MREDMKKFMEAAESKEELKAKIAEIENQGAEETVKQMISLAAEYGCTLTEEDFVVANDGELSEEELEGVSGGIFLGIVNKPTFRTLRYYSGEPVKTQRLDTQGTKTAVPASNQPQLI